MGSLFSSPKPPALPPPPPPPPTRENAPVEVAESRKALRASELKRRGRASTIKTGGRGVEGELGVSRPAASDKLG